MHLETERLILRDLAPEDYNALRRIMDVDTMWAYGHAFSDRDVADWLARQISRREIWSFSLCAVELKATGEVIGQCGLTVQDCLDGHVPEIGYVFSRENWHHGYATEAAAAVRRRADQRERRYSCAKWEATAPSAAAVTIWRRGLVRASPTANTPGRRVRVVSSATR